MEDAVLIFVAMFAVFGFSCAVREIRNLIRRLIQRTDFLRNQIDKDR